MESKAKHGVKSEAVEPSTKTHEGHVALVTGASQGIGQAIPAAWAERGARVIATDLKPPHDTAGRIGPLAHAFELDVTRQEQWRSLAAEFQAAGEVDIVVNNAGLATNVALSGRGAKVANLPRSTDALEKLAQRLPGSLPLTVDMTQFDGVREGSAGHVCALRSHRRPR